MSNKNKVDVLEIGSDGMRVDIGDKTEKGFEIRVHLPNEWSLESALELSIQIQQLYELHKKRNEDELNEIKK